MQQLCIVKYPPVTHVSHVHHRVQFRGSRRVGRSLVQLVQLQERRRTLGQGISVLWLCLQRMRVAEHRLLVLFVHEQRVALVLELHLDVFLVVATRRVILVQMVFLKIV